MTTDSNRAVTDLIGGLTSLSRDAAAMDAATVNIYRALLDDAVRAAALAQVERDDAIAKVDAADQRVRSLDAALEAERDVSKGLRVHAEACELIMKEAGRVGEERREELDTIRSLVAPGNQQGTVVDAVRARIQRCDDEQRASDRCAAAADKERDAAIARAEKAEADLRKAVDGYERVTLLQAQTADDAARLRARVAELEARPVLTHEILSAAIKKARKVPPYIARQAADEYMPHLGPVTLPGPDRAEELAATLVGTARASMTDVPIAWSCDFADGNENARRALTNVVRTALAKLAPAVPAPMPVAATPARSDLAAIASDVLACAMSWSPEARLIGNVRADEIAALARAVKAPPAPVEFTAASVEELALAFYSARDPGHRIVTSDIDSRDRAAIRAVLAAARIHAVTADGLAGGLASLGTTISTPTLAEALKRAAAQKVEVIRG